MKKNKKRIVSLTLQLIVLAIFVLTIFKYNSDKINPRQVFAYASNLEAGTRITESDLIRVPISSMTVTTDMVPADDYASIVGRYLKTDVFVNTLAYTQQLADTNSTGMLASLDLSNSVLISLPLDMIESLAGDIEAGDYVDLLFKSQGAAESAQGSENEFYYAKIFMRNLPVYQVNTTDGYKWVSRADMTVTDVNANPSEAGELTGNESGEMGSITLVVTPEQFEQIEARRLAGEIKIAKRFDETQNHETLGFVIGNYGKIFSGNANAETGNLQIVDSYVDDDPNNARDVNTAQGNVTLGDSEKNGNQTTITDGNGNGTGTGTGAGSTSGGIAGGNTTVN